MKRNFTLLLSAWMFCAAGANAQTSDNFNSRPGADIPHVKGFLQGQCWKFTDFDTNNDGWAPGIEGDGAMVSGPSASATQSTGIYTPVLDIAGELTVRFKYKFNTPLGNGERRWFKIYLTDADNNIFGVYLDSVEVTNINTSTVYQYNKSWNFPDIGTGAFKVYVNFQGIGGSTRIGIDEFWVSPRKKYNSGCNSAPIAVPDVFTGTNTRTASGRVTLNDRDPDGEIFFAELVTGSPNGQVVLYSNGQFTFAPNPGWTGTTTSFTYKICDNGSPILCSETVTVTLNFPGGGPLPVSLIDFKGLYKDNGEVELSWITTFEQNSDRFEVLRSFDGSDWIIAGKLPAAGTSSDKKSYSFIDDVGRSVTKKDLYYQLRQLDKDGRSYLSKILVVRVYNTRSLKMVSVTPNPVKSDISVNVQLNEPSYVVMKVLNTSGSEMMRKSSKAGAGANTFIVDGSSNLRPGMYLLEVTINSKERMIVKLLKE